jgi:hypothetical protein
MHLFFATLFVFGILTLWVPSYWPVTVFQVGIFALAGVTVWRTRLTPPAFVWPLAPFCIAVLWGLVQGLTGRTVYPIDTNRAVLQWTTFLCVFVIGLSLFRDDAIRRWFRSAVLWFTFAVAILATLQSFTSKGKVFWLFTTPYTDNVMGPILNPNHYAALIEVVLPIALYMAVLGERNSLLYAGMAAAMYASVIASASRAGAVLATFEIVLVPLLLWGFRRTTGRNVTAALLRVGALLAAFTVVVGWESVWNHLWAPDPLSVRRELALASFHMAQAHPWFGVGLGTWPIVYPSYALIDTGSIVNQAHNDWLQWTAEGGFPFGILLATVFFWSLRPAFRSIWGIGVVAFFLHAIVDYPFSRPALGSWAILILSLLAFNSAESNGREQTHDAQA